MILAAGLPVSHCRGAHLVETHWNRPSLSGHAIQKPPQPSPKGASESDHGPQRRRRQQAAALPRALQRVERLTRRARMGPHPKPCPALGAWRPPPARAPHGRASPWALGAARAYSRTSSNRSPRRATCTTTSVPTATRTVSINSCCPACTTTLYGPGGSASARCPATPFATCVPCAS